MKPASRIGRGPARGRQRGLALFFALICMVAIMLAAIVLVRSVDTATLISGNLAFQQNATRSADGGAEAAIVWLLAQQAANSQKNALIDATHAFNADAPTAGYYSSLDPAISLTATSGTRFVWDATDSVGLAADSSGNTVRYIIQRMCRTANVPVGDVTARCLMSAATVDTNKQNIMLPQEVCNGPGCPAAGQTPQVRITSRTTGPKNTLSYIQTFVY
jgi:type IV pilus assembly protein PilX